MKLLLLFLFLARNEADDILVKTSQKLNAATAISYAHERDYFTGDKHFITKADNYFDFNSDDKLIGMRYWSQTAEYSIIFNGTENFVLNKKNKTISINNKPTGENLEGGSYYYNSLVTLRRNLPVVIADKSIKKILKDTIYEGRQVYLVRFTLFKKLMNNFGGFMSIIEDRYFHFGLMIDKSSYLPLCLTQSNSVDEHTAIVTYKNITINPAPVKDDVWYYSTYSSAYKFESKKEEPVPLAAGLTAPNFEVKDFISGSAINRNKYNGKTLLLEFWIRNCGPCIESVPKLNALKNEFKELQILAINAHDRKETVDYFVKRYNVQYPVAYGGEEAARQYGIAAFPAVFLINEKGNIIYSGAFDHDKIAKLLDKRD